MLYIMLGVLAVIVVALMLWNAFNYVKHHKGVFSTFLKYVIVGHVPILVICGVFVIWTISHPLLLDLMQWIYIISLGQLIVLFSMLLGLLKIDVIA